MSFVHQWERGDPGDYETDDFDEKPEANPEQRLDVVHRRSVERAIRNPGIDL